MCCQNKKWIGLGALLLAGLIGFTGWVLAEDKKAAERQKPKDKKAVDKVHPKDKAPESPDSLNPLFQLPNESWKLPAHLEQPITFVNRNQNAAEWEALKGFWNVVPEKVADPVGKEFTRTAVKIKVPLGLNANPPVPAENPMTVAKWKLGKKLYFDAILGSDGNMSCASCHDPRKGFTDQSNVSKGIGGARGGVSA